MSTVVDSRCCIGCPLCCRGAVDAQNSVSARAVRESDTRASQLLFDARKPYCTHRLSAWRRRQAARMAGIIEMTTPVRRESTRTVSSPRASSSST